MQIQSESKPYDSINVTPMLDLAYVLLVIFIIMTTASVQGLSIDLPKPSNKPVTEKHDLKIIQILPDGSLHLNGAGVSVGELEIQLKSALARDPKTAVVLKGDPAVNYARVVEVLDLTGAMGIGSVGLITARIGN
ncbi:biopolymer transporter ExbD [Rhodocyclus tenuis]|uniref:Biopolymer transporter ExbD n=2 Tax=Rhodocyclus TaxID=1064 RepID=A0A6L5JXU9_RHOTE|nr:biopolymer transporter ExbD [Rhodocyclus gracilis]MQY51008.1 biopolymer transporter ExbD [Rhodocyclus gracilis]MRD72987.1 biopolymer transporter ExbD [Rhodocyclus gracilis]NJA88718.1 biopolymer transporter ExbD [Rhodocyclus gracilis]